MGLAALVKRAAALLVAAGLSAFLVAGISADDGNEEAVAARVLQPTQVVAEIPEEYNELFELQWGGGSLYQFKGRLATMGCIVNTIWLYDNNKWNVYNQYTISQDNPIIQQFKQQYEQLIPAGTLWADCYRICEFTQARLQWTWLFVEPNTECLSFEYVRQKNFYDAPHSVSETTSCNDDFDPRVKEKVFPILPLHPDVCIARQQVNVKNQQFQIGYGIIGYAPFITLNAPPVVIIYNNTHTNIYRNNAERDLITLKMEIHELCHINQAWQWIQDIHLDKRIYNAFYDFEISPQGKKFIDIIGFTSLGQTLGSRAWQLPSDSVYKNIYHKDPAELSAELCSMYLLDKMGERSSYDYETYNSGKFYRVPIRTIDVNKYLTPEIREWLETYIILPEIIEEDAE